MLVGQAGHPTDQHGGYIAIKLLITYNSVIATD
ncbi:hypothetical protein Poras_0828 [Porphyromonas asaccharolytica DSM 20707]|uniref:Uncharacterized protein n=1 Tax=Porphyromonas asaccharolytica (strain ATCC 25260 / DSM 20707 / BCRC 10618 / CCUG 7834 / JCM 6326 / LMG 13178 / VPI 4198 / B440) TaxID=879243 RepID=F4KK47_PORAD|nr:hypothetical protein Poras_0828 [Porphyromonas asaccharolytica DSM 20707]